MCDPGAASSLPYQLPSRSRDSDSSIGDCSRRWHDASTYACTKDRGKRRKRERRMNASLTQPAGMREHAATRGAMRQALGTGDARLLRRRTATRVRGRRLASSVALLAACSRSDATTARVDSPTVATPAAASSAPTATIGADSSSSAGGLSALAIPGRDAEDGQWLRPAKDYASTRFSGLDQITTANAASLKLAWSFSTGVLRGQEAAPLVVGSTMYVVTPYPNILYALDLTKPGAP